MSIYENLAPRPGSAVGGPPTLQTIEDMLWAALLGQAMVGVALGGWVAWRLARRVYRRV